MVRRSPSEKGFQAQPNIPATVEFEQAPSRALRKGYEVVKNRERTTSKGNMLPLAGYHSLRILVFFLDKTEVFG